MVSGTVGDRLGQRLPPGCGREGVGEVLGFVADQVTGELHDAHRVGGHAVVGDHDLADPELATAADPVDGEGALGRVPAPLSPDLRPAAESLAGLRVVQDRVGRVDCVLGVGVSGFGGLPVLLDPGPGAGVIHVLHHCPGGRPAAPVVTRAGALVRPASPVSRARAERPMSSGAPRMWARWLGPAKLSPGMSATAANRTGRAPWLASWASRRTMIFATGPPSR